MLKFLSPLCNMGRFTAVQSLFGLKCVSHKTCHPDKCRVHSSVAPITVPLPWKHVVFETCAHPEQEPAPRAGFTTPSPRLLIHLQDFCLFWAPRVARVESQCFSLELGLLRLARCRRSSSRLPVLPRLSAGPHLVCPPIR